MRNINEAYEDESHPSTVGFWQDFETPEGRHQYGDHPVLGQHGHDLSKAGFEHAGEHLARRDLVFDKDHPTKGIGMGSLTSIVQKIFMKEARHKDKLIEHAKDIVSR